jgi:hypothetical protein
MLARDKCSSLLWIVATYGRKKFYNIGPRCDKIDKNRFEENYVRRRKPVKIVGCVEQSDLSTFSVEHLFEQVTIFLKTSFLRSGEAASNARMGEVG